MVKIMQWYLKSSLYDILNGVYLPYGIWWLRDRWLFFPLCIHFQNEKHFVHSIHLLHCNYYWCCHFCCLLRVLKTASSPLYAQIFEFTMRPKCATKEQTKAHTHPHIHTIEHINDNSTWPVSPVKSKFSKTIARTPHYEIWKYESQDSNDDVFCLCFIKVKRVKWKSYALHELKSNISRLSVKFLMLLEN